MYQVKHDLLVDPSMPKIAVGHLSDGRPGFLLAHTGKPFYPEGNVLQQTNSQSIQIHFNEGIYSHESTKTALLRMRNAGYNVVRVWVDCAAHAENYGIGGPESRNVPELYPPYMDNFVDFLQLATHHRLYVIVANLFFPHNCYYRGLRRAPGDPPGLVPAHDGTNLHFYTEGGVVAVSAFLRQFAKEVKDRVPDLVNTVFAFEVWNEIHSVSDQFPFNQASTVTVPVSEVWTGNGLRDLTVDPFDMQIPSDRQLCHDVVLGYFLRECAKGIRSEIPDALVSTSVFTNKAVGKPGFNGLLGEGIVKYLFCVDPQFVNELDDSALPEALRAEFLHQCRPLSDETMVRVEEAGRKWKLVGANTQYLIKYEKLTLNVYIINRRWPARIRWLPNNTELSYIDIHFYPSGDGYCFLSDIESLEWSDIDKTQKPFFSGEIGAIRDRYPTLSSASTMLGRLRDNLYAEGFSGYTFYNWNNIWNKTSEELEGYHDNYWSIELPNGQGGFSYPIAGILSPAVRWRLFEFDGNDLEGWTTKGMADVTVLGGNLSARFTDINASMKSETGLGIDTEYVRTVKIRIKNESNANGFDLYWITDTDEVWGEDKAVRTSQSYSDQFEVIEFDLWNHSKWAGTVEQLYLVPGRLWGGDAIYGGTTIDYIRVLDSI